MSKQELLAECYLDFVRIITAVLRPYMDAQDAADEAHSAIEAALEDEKLVLKNRAECLAWLKTVAKNRSVTKFRSDRVHKRILKRIYVEKRAENGEVATDSSSLAPFIQVLLKDVLPHLPEVEQRLLEDRYFNKMTYDKLASQGYCEAKSNAQAIRRRLIGILKRIREFMEARDAAPEGRDSAVQSSADGSQQANTP